MEIFVIIVLVCCVFGITLLAGKKLHDLKKELENTDETLQIESKKHFQLIKDKEAIERDLEEHKKLNQELANDLGEQMNKYQTEHDQLIRTQAQSESLAEKTEELVQDVANLTSQLSKNVVVVLENSNGLVSHFDSVLNKEIYVNDPVLNLLMTHTKEFRDSLEEVQNVLLSYVPVVRVDTGNKEV